MRTSLLKYLIPGALWLCTPAQVILAQGIITTVAGNGITQYIGDGFPATSFSLAAPAGLCIDASGNVYESDYAVARIRKLNAASSISTYAGTGTLGYSGDGGPASSALIRYPTGMAVNATGDVYFADEYNKVVRRIDATTHIITTVCGNGGGGFAGDGGPATDAHLEEPAGICLDKNGNLYIADKGNNRIRKVSASTGTITTLAGNGLFGYGGDGGIGTDAALTAPTGVCADTLGNIFIADRGNNVIRRVDATTGIITTMAGNGAADYGGDGGPAANATMAQPNNVFMSRRYNLYISDNGNNRVRVVTSDGIMHTLAGSGDHGYAGDGGPALAATFLGPTAVCADEQENVYIADGGNSVIRKVTPVYNGIKELPQAGTFVLYPNPSAGIFTLMTSTQLPADARVTVTNVLGSVVYAGPCHQNGSIDLSSQPPGVYCVYLRWSGGSICGKAIIAK